MLADKSPPAVSTECAEHYWRRARRPGNAEERPGADHGHDPERRDADVRERLERLALKGRLQKAGEAEVFELIPRFGPAIEAVVDDSEQDEAEVSA